MRKTKIRKVQPEVVEGKANLPQASNGSRSLISRSVEYPESRLEQYAEITRNLIAQENLRANERATWLIQLQGLLFTALAFAWKDAHRLVWLLVGLGIFSTLAIGNSLRWTTKAIDSIEDEWSTRGDKYSGPRIIGLGKHDGMRYERWGLHPQYNLPLIFILGWLVVLIFHRYR